MDKEIRLSFWQILMSPFISIRNMVSEKSDIETERHLNENSENKIEAELAKSSKNIDSKVASYGNSGKAQRREVLESVKVEQKDLKKQKDTAKSAQAQVKEDKTR